MESSIFALSAFQREYYLLHLCSSIIHYTVHIQYSICSYLYGSVDTANHATAIVCCQPRNMDV
jgi:hypothetical protein